MWTRFGQSIGRLACPSFSILLQDCTSVLQIRTTIYNSARYFNDFLQLSTDNIGLIHHHTAPQVVTLTKKSSRFITHRPWQEAQRKTTLHTRFHHHSYRYPCNAISYYFPHLFGTVDPQSFAGQPTTPGTSVSTKFNPSSAPHTPNQKALLDLAKHAHKTGKLDLSNAETLMRWSQEYNLISALTLAILDAVDRLARSGTFILAR